MKVAVFNTRSFDRRHLEAANADGGHELIYLTEDLTAGTCVLATGFPAVSCKSPSRVDAPALGALAENGTRLVALRTIGFDYVDIGAAHDLGLTVVRVPAYSPHAVAEHAVALILALNRKIHRAYNRVREGNLSLEGLVGFDLHGRTVGIVGTGHIGMVVAQILRGFGCRLLAYSRTVRPECEALGLSYVSLPELFASSDIITLHTHLTDETYHIIDARALRQMKPGVMLINTGRGGLIDTKAVIDALKSGRIGYLGLDVYEQETSLFQQDLSNVVIQDDVFERLLTFPNVIVTGHQGFLTEDALKDIADTTIGNITLFERGEPCPNEVTQEFVSRARRKLDDDEVELDLLVEHVHRMTYRG